MRFTEFISEDANPKRQAAIAIAMKKAGKKPKSVSENDTAAGINKMFNNLGDPVFSNLQRVALLAMQGRQQEASGRLQSVIKDASPAVQKKIIDAVNNIKPVTINGKIADSSTIDKSKSHQDWILNTFIPWVQSLLDQQGVAEGLEQKLVTIYTNPAYKGATVDDRIKKSLPVTEAPFNKLQMWENGKSMKDPKVAQWVNNNLLPQLKQNGKLGPLVVWNNKGKLFVIDGNHRFIAYQAAGYNGNVPVQIVPDKMINIVDTVPGQQGVAEDMSRRGFLKGAGAMAAGITAASGAHADEKSDPNKLTASMLMGGEFKEFDLTPFIEKNNWVGSPKQVINQAEKWLSDFLRKRGNMYSNLKIKYKGLTMTSSKIGDIDASDPEFESVMKESEQDIEEGENWSKHNNKRAGGMSKKSVSVYRREHPGSKIQTAVTTKPSKLKKGSKAAKRRASFCARMRGMKKHRTGAKTAHDPNSNINKSLRRWHCESIEELHELVMLAEQFIRNNKK